MQLTNNPDFYPQMPQIFADKYFASAVFCEIGGCFRSIVYPVQNSE